MKRGRIVIISGPSGSGKTTLHKKLLLSRKLKNILVKSISATTRRPRAGEKPGRDYFFLTRERFLARRKKGYFLEWQKVFDRYYGTPEQYVKKLLKTGKNVLLCIEVKGAKVVARKYPEALRVFIRAPSWAMLKKRLMARGTENSRALELRLKTARQEMKEARNYNYIVVNADFKQAIKELESIVLKELTTV